MACILLEANPEATTKFLHKLGVPKKWGISDVYGVDPVLLAMIPKPVLAVIFSYPTPKNDLLKNKRVVKIKETGQDVSEGIFYIRECVSNACGTIALIHGIANNSDAIQLEEGHLKSFLDNAKDLSPLEREELLVKTEGIIHAHEELAPEGQTEAPCKASLVDHHFVTFVQKYGQLYELDGRESMPICHGPSTPATFLEDATRVCQEYMWRNPYELSFTIIALAAKE